MALSLEVQFEGKPNGDVAVVGSDENIWGWDTGKALRLKNSEEEPSVWRGEIPLPISESEFKLIVVQAGGAIEWEPLPDGANRKFPERGVHNGAVLRMQFGVPKIGIQVSAEELEAMARRTRKMEDRAGSALQDNLNRKGDNAYYHAHSRNFEVPPDAKVISGPGLITGGAPVLLEASSMVDSSEQDRTVFLKDYSWSDSTNKVKVYIPVPEGLLPQDGADELVVCDYQTTQIELTINCKPRQRLKIEKLNGELTVEKCTTRVEAHKNRIVLQLAKKRETTWYDLTKK